MNKPVYGLVLGGVLGIFDGLSALVSAPETAPQIGGIVIGSTIKGILAGALIGFFASRVRSVPLGILFGAAVGAALAYLVVIMGNPYLWEIVLPGTLLGIIVGYATQRHTPAVRKAGAATLGVLAALAAAGAAPAWAQGPASAAPGPEHKRLGFYVGTWTVEGELKPGPMGPGGKFTSTDTCEWFDGGFAVVCRSEGRMPGGPARSIGILGYSAEEKVYTYYAVDNTSMTMVRVPRGTVQGDTWTYTDEGTMGGQHFKTRVVIKEESPTVQRFTMAMQGPDGKWMTVMESRGTKAPS
jgi:hypothetical protein